MNQRDEPLPLSTTAVPFLGYSAVMLVLESRLKQTGGPGIVPFELAGDASSAEDIMASWGRDGQRKARLSLMLDFGYMATYGMFAAALVDRARRHQGHPPWLPAAMVVPVAADAMEGISLLKVLNGEHIAGNAQRARKAALTKFAVLAGGLAYVIGSMLRDHDQV